MILLFYRGNFKAGTSESDSALAIEGCWLKCSLDEHLKVFSGPHLICGSGENSSLSSWTQFVDVLSVCAHREFS